MEESWNGTQMLNKSKSTFMLQELRHQYLVQTP